MARYINGKRVENSEDKRKAVEGAGGTYNEIIEGDYIEGKSVEELQSKQPKTKEGGKPRNYVENLGGERVERWYD